MMSLVAATAESTPCACAAQKNRKALSPMALGDTDPKSYSTSTITQDEAAENFKKYLLNVGLDFIV